MSQTPIPCNRRRSFNDDFCPRDFTSCIGKVSLFDCRRVVRCSRAGEMVTIIPVDMAMPLPLAQTP